MRRQLAPQRASAAERLRAWSQPEPNSGCYLWVGALTKFGYPKIHIKKGTVYAHRLAYETFVGPIPDGLTIDHTCNNPSCVNERHLVVATRRENILRGNNMAARNARRTHCIRGHEFSPENTRVNRGPSGLFRTCRTCAHLRKSGALKAAS